MIQVKTFSSEGVDKLNEKVNEFLRTLPPDRFKDWKQSECNDCISITILYEED